MRSVHGPAMLASVELGRRLVEAADRERRRIARDLHDGLQSRLVVLAIRANAIRTTAADPAVRVEAAEMEAALHAAIDELRALVHGVMPAALAERGLYAAAEDLVDRMPLPTELRLATNGHPLPPSVQSTGYFVASEALTNAVKHARARELMVGIAHIEDRLRVEVRDDGVGGVQPGAGIRGMSDRVRAHGGRLSVASPRGAGTSVIAELPCGS